MKKTQANWYWQDGVVDNQKEHFDLRYGNASKTQGKDWSLIARIGKPEQNLFPVEWLFKPDSPEDQAVLTAARKELTFYLVEHGGPDPWAYVCYHCSTAANIYSLFHWSYFPDDRSVDSFSSMVREVSNEDAQELRGEVEEDGEKATGGRQ